jgi:DNA-binding MarR family transcriptional regulator
MNEAYWKERCLAAERALALARRGLQLSAPRRAMLALLADLKADASADTHRIARHLNCTANRAHDVLRAMEGLGLVEREKGRPGPRGLPAGWKLGYLVQVEAFE